MENMANNESVKGQKNEFVAKGVMKTSGMSKTNRNTGKKEMPSKKLQAERKNTASIK